MDDGSPSLEVGFEIDTGGSFDSLTQLQNLMDSAEAKIVAEAGNIERATKGMVNLGGGTAQFTAFGNAATRELRNINREKASTEKAGEKMIRQLEREAAALGRTKDEMRDARIEVLALQAAEQGNIDLYDRLFAASRRRQFAAEAAAEAEMKATQAAQQAANAATFGDRADRLRASIDPAAAAQQRFNREMAEARILISAGAISLDDYVAKLRMEQAALNASSAGHVRLGGGANASRMAMQGASYQVQDFITQVSMGANPIQAFSVQGAQLAGQFSNIEGKAGAVARFFMTPWGLAITAGMMVLGPLVAKLMDQNDALDDSVGKLRKNAAETETAAKAKEAFAWSLDGVTAALNENEVALKRLEDAEKSAARRSLESAIAQQERLATIKQTTAALLEQARAELEAARSMSFGAAGGAGAAQAQMIYAGRVAELQEMAAQATADADRAQQQTVRALGVRLAELSKERADPMGRITREFDQQIKRAREQASAEEVINGTLARRYDLINANRRAAEEVERERSRLSSATANQGGRNIGLMDARSIVEGMGGQVTSTLRDRETQQRLYDKYMAYKAGSGPWAAVAAKPGTSNHELGQAIDVAKTDGMTLKKLIAAFRAKGVALTEWLDEGSHFHLAWKKVGVAAQEQTAVIRAAAREATDAEATKAQIDNLYALSKAYGESGGAALVAAARVKAESEAIRAKGDIEASVARDVALAIAQQVADAARNTAGMRDQASVQGEVNAAVAAGLIPAERASELMQEKMQDLPLLAAIEAATATKNAEGAKQATAALEAQRAARQRLAEEERKAAFNTAMASGQDRLDELREELRLVRETDAARTIALATLRATKEAEKLNPEDRAAYIAQQREIAELTVELATSQDNYNASLSHTRDLLSAIGDQAGTLSGILSDAFGGFGDSIGGLITTLTELNIEQQSISDWRRDEMRKAGGDAQRMAQIEVLAAKQSQTAQTRATAQAISGVKSLFKEKSTAFKVISAIEKAYAVWQAAETIASMVRDTTKTVSSIANSTARATAAGAEGVANQSKLPFPYNIAAMAATAAALIAAGVAVFGGGGGGSAGPTIPSSDELQEGAGTGTVLGDMKAKSDSIARSLELVAANTNNDLQYSSEMLKALRSIDTSIAQMAGTVARQIQVSGSMFDTSGLGLGDTAKKGFLGLFGGSSTSKTLWDLGMTLNSGTLADIIANGIDGQTYQTIQKIKTKNGFLGIGGGTKTSYSTTYGDIDGDIVAAISGVLGSLRDGLVAAADIIGLEGAEAMLAGFQVNIGKISFKDMTGEEIVSQLNAIFSSIGDQMAGTLLPSLASMQLVGEGLFETFIRVAKQYEAVDVAMTSIGRSFGAIGLESVAARDALVQLFGGLDEFLEATNAFRDQFLTEAEQIAPVQAAVAAELQRLGMTGITTREQLKATVLGLDLTTEAGRDMYAALLALAPAFDKVLDYQEQAQKATIDGLKQTIDQFTKFAESLKKYRDGLFAADVAQGNAYDRLRAQFSATAALAATGDATALGGLENAGKSFLDASRGNASTREQYLRDVAMVARGVDRGIFAAEETADYAQLQLDALGNAVSILTAIDANTAATAAALGSTVTTPSSGSLPAAPVPSTPSAGQLLDAAGNATAIMGGSGGGGEQTSKLAEQNDRMIGQGSDLNDTMKRVERILVRFEGDGMPVRTADGEELDINLKSWG
jgi:hypothetical protein